jgi:hypothetical protein
MLKIFFSFVLLASAISLAAQDTENSTITIRSQSNLQRTQQEAYAAQRGLQEGNKKIDTSKLVKKTISQEIELPGALDVLIATKGEMVIHTWNENKVKIQTKVQFEGTTELTDMQWLDKLGISMKIFGSTVKIKSSSSNGFSNLNSNGTITLTSASPFFSNTGTLLNGQRGAYQSVVLYIPAESLLDIESNYGRLEINNNIKNLILNNTDGEIAFANIEKLKLRGNRGSITGGIVDNADIELSHGRLALQQINKGTMTTRYCTIEIETLKDANISSSNDEMDFDEVGAVYGTKNYGNIRINQLTGKLDLKGVSSDIKLRHVRSSAQLVRITNRNADLRLPVNDLSNFSVDIRGPYNKIYSFFSESATIDTLTAQEMDSVKSMTNTVTSSGNTINITSGTSFSQSGGGRTIPITPIAVNVYGFGGGGGRQNPYLKYTAKVGSGNSSLNYQIICTSCVIDFK